MFRRIYPIFVSMLGAAGLGVSMSFLAGAYLAYEPGWEEWAAFFMPRAVYLIVVPYVLLLGYLYLRSNLGDWFLRRGYVDEAIAYCEPRIEHNLMRSRAEAFGNRIALARAFTVQGDYEHARELLESGFKPPKSGRARLQIARWRMEVALRQENLLRCHRAFDQVSGTLRPTKQRRPLDVCRAELAVREGDRSAFKKALERANWKGARLPRLQWVEVLAALRFGDSATAQGEAGNFTAEDPAVLLARLDSIRDEPGNFLPSLGAELLAIRAELLYKSGEPEQARQQLDAVESAHCDARSKYEIERVRAIIESK